MKRIIFCFLAAIVVVISCKKDEDPCTKDPCSYSKDEAQIQALQYYIDTSKTVATKHCSGIFYNISVAGTGANPTPCGRATVTYRGTLLDGKEFDKSTIPVEFSLQSLIDSWKIMIPLLKPGGKIRIFVPPYLGYGQAGSGTSIPPNSVLVFDIALVSTR